MAKNNLYLIIVLVALFILFAADKKEAGVTNIEVRSYIDHTETRVQLAGHQFFDIDKITYSCQGDLCYANDVDFTCGNFFGLGNKVCESYESASNCPLDCACPSRNQWYPPDCRYVNEHYPGLYDSGNVAVVDNFLKNVVGLSSTTYTTNDAEIWSKTKKIVDWIATHEVEHDYVVQGKTCWQYRNENTPGGTTSGATNIGAIPGMYDMYGGICFYGPGPCGSVTYTISMLMERAGIPRERILWVSTKSHVWNAVYVQGSWYGFDYLALGDPPRPMTDTPDKFANGHMFIRKTFPVVAMDANGLRDPPLLIPKSHLVAGIDYVEVGDCLTFADVDCNGVVSTSEMRTAVTLFENFQVSRPDINQVVVAWVI